MGGVKFDCILLQSSTSLVKKYLLGKKDGCVG